MNPHLHRTKHRRPKPGETRPAAAVLDVWRTARGVEAVQLLFLTSRCGADGAVAAAHAVVAKLRPVGLLVKVVADEFKLVVRSAAQGEPLSDLEVSVIVLELTRALEAAGVERA